MQSFSFRSEREVTSEVITALYDARCFVRVDADGTLTVAADPAALQAGRRMLDAYSAGATDWQAAATASVDAQARQVEQRTIERQKGVVDMESPTAAPAVAPSGAPSGAAQQTTSAPDARPNAKTASDRGTDKTTGAANKPATK